MPQNIGDMLDRKLEADTEEYMRRRGEKCGDCGGDKWYMDEEDDGNKTRYVKKPCPTCEGKGRVEGEE